MATTRTGGKAAALPLNQRINALGAQFQGLDMQTPHLWPVLPRVVLAAVLVLVVLLLAWVVHLSGMSDKLHAERYHENMLKQQYSMKLAKAVNLEELRRQREQVRQYVMQLERQLPSRSEMASLLSDINQAGKGHDLQFDLFKPGTEILKPYYAELPIAIKVTGQFDDIGNFASDVAHLPRIVTLGGIKITPERPASNTDFATLVTRTIAAPLVMEATAYTYRYLEAHEATGQAIRGVTPPEDIQ